MHDRQVTLHVVATHRAGERPKPRLSLAATSPWRPRKFRPGEPQYAEVPRGFSQLSAQHLLEVLRCMAADSMIGSFHIWKEVLVDPQEANSMGIDCEGLLHAHLPGIAFWHLNDPCPLWFAWPAQDCGCIEGQHGRPTARADEQPLAVDHVRGGTGTIWILAEREEAIYEIAWRIGRRHGGSVTGSVENFVEDALRELGFFFRFSRLRNGSILPNICGR